MKPRGDCRQGLPPCLELATFGVRDQTDFRNGRKEKTMTRLSLLLALILAVAIPSFSLGAEPQDKQGAQINKQQVLQSIRQFKDQKKTEFEQLKQRLKESGKRELQELKDKLKAAKPEDRENLKKELDQKKTALKEQAKRELDQKKDQFKAELKQLVEQTKKKIQEKMKK